MQISIETTKGLERRLTISVPSEEFEAKITHRLGEAATKVRIPGFRPGRVPLKEIRRRFGPAVRAEVAGELMQSSFVEAVGRESFSPAGSPTLEVVKMDPGTDFEFTATFEVFPFVELADLAGVAVKRPHGEITETDLEEMILHLREQRTVHIPVERPAEEDDRVTVDFTGTIDGEAFTGSSGEGVAFVIGGGQMIEGFDLGVRGLSNGESATFPTTFPEDYQAEELRGKTAEFDIAVKEVAEPNLPDLSEEFFRGFGIEEGGESAFRKDVRANMQRELDAAINKQVKTQVMDQIFALHNLQLPSVVVHKEIHALKDQMRQQFQTYGGGTSAEVDLPDNLFTEQAERRVAVGLVINEIVATANLVPDPEKVRARIETLAAGYAEPQQVINYYMSNDEQRQQIEMSVLEDQVVDHILEKAGVEEVPSTYNEILSGQAVTAPRDHEVPPEGAEARSDDPAGAAETADSNAAE